MPLMGSKPTKRKQQSSSLFISRAKKTSMLTNDLVQQENEYHTNDVASCRQPLREMTHGLAEQAQIIKDSNTTSSTQSGGSKEVDLIARKHQSLKQTHVKHKRGKANTDKYTLSNDSEALMKPQNRCCTSRSRNIVYMLLQQSLHGRLDPRIRDFTRKSTTWKHAKWIQLHECCGFRHVTKIAWDVEGELLAVAYSNQQGGNLLVIYDWQTILAADSAGARSHQRRLEKKNVVEPLFLIPLKIGKGSIVQLMEWNPYNPDELVVGLR